jgi:multisubunit Na+/H+ antiporter MnhF subunit
MIGLAVICALIRILRGPATPDRIVAVDLLASLVMAAMLLSGIASGNPFYLQSVLGFAVVLFLGTVALARYLDHPDGDPDN